MGTCNSWFLRAVGEFGCPFEVKVDDFEVLDVEEIFLLHDCEQVCHHFFGRPHEHQSLGHQSVVLEFELL